jgi:hypothetical protein
MVAVARAKEEEVMTDYQFKALMAMAIELVKNAGTIENAVKLLESIKDGQTKADGQDGKGEG